MRTYFILVVLFPFLLMTVTGCSANNPAQCDGDAMDTTTDGDQTDTDQDTDVTDHDSPDIPADGDEPETENDPDPADGDEEEIAPDPCEPNPCTDPYRSVCTAGDDGNVVCSCDDGFTDYGDGRCKPSDPCAGETVCAALHRNCENNAGLAVCGDCAGGYHMSGADCVANIPCSQDICNGHGDCSDTSGIPVCHCFAGYIGDACESCDHSNGWHLNAAASACTDNPCDPDPCNSTDNRHCDTETGACLCDSGYCDIDGQCIADGEAHPESGCSLCDAAANPNGWSPRPQGIECRPAAGPCDPAELCDGLNHHCPIDVFASDGTACGENDQCVSGLCADCHDGAGCQDLAWGDRSPECSRRVCGNDNICRFDDETDSAVCGDGDQCIAGVCRDCFDNSGCLDLAWGSHSPLCSARMCQNNACVFHNAEDGTGCGGDNQCLSGACLGCADIPGCADGDVDLDEELDFEEELPELEADPEPEAEEIEEEAETIDTEEDPEVCHGCMIDGQCIADGAANPDSRCAYCNPAENPRGWSPRLSGTMCREALGPCDVAETCDGISLLCPEDQLYGAETLCRPAMGICDVEEHCDGMSTACGPDIKYGAETLCREAAGICDVSEVCDGISNDCPSDLFSLSTDICREAVEPCDRSEYCTGFAAYCPEDIVLSAGYNCRESRGVCDMAEHCDGANKACPDDLRHGEETLCRAVEGICDVAEACNGLDDDCPADAKAGPETVCRPAAVACDAPEVCNGTDNLCPDNILKAEGESCGDPADTQCDNPDTCDDAGNCLVNHAPAGTECDTGVDCSDYDVCDGLGACSGTAYDCNEHGTCNGNDHCSCDARYAGEYCDQCAENRYFYPHCITCAPGESCYPPAPTRDYRCFDNNGVIECPGIAGDASCGTTPYCGQDPQYPDNPLSARDYSCSVFDLSVSCNPYEILPHEVVTDSLTGSMWQRSFENDMTWQQAHDYCEALDYGGYGDWRLPRIPELLSIVDFADSTAPLDTTAFPGTPHGIGYGYSDDKYGLWTSSPAKYGSSNEIMPPTRLALCPYSHYCYFQVTSIDESQQFETGVRCIRSGKTATVPDENRYILKHHNTVVEDVMTGLEWIKLGPPSQDWAGAMAQCESYEHFEQGSDWRLPNIHELLSIYSFDATPGEMPLLRGIVNIPSSTANTALLHHDLYPDISFVTSPGLATNTGNYANIGRSSPHTYDAVLCVQGGL